MGLSFDFTEIENWSEVCHERLTEPPEGYDSLEAFRAANCGWGSNWGWTDDEKTTLSRIRPQTDALIWGTMSIGIGEITQANYQEVYERYYVYERAFGARLSQFNEATGEREDVFTSLETIKAHIGLSTNVFPKRTKTKFKNEIMRELFQQAAGAFIASEQDTGDET